MMGKVNIFNTYAFLLSNLAIVHLIIPRAFVCVNESIQEDPPKPCTVKVIWTSTEPNRFLATHSYCDVSSFCTAVSRNELLDKTVILLFPTSDRPCWDHSTVGSGSPPAWQFSITVFPASAMVSIGSTVNTGEPGEEMGSLIGTK